MTPKQMIASLIWNPISAPQRIPTIETSAKIQSRGAHTVKSFFVVIAYNVIATTTADVNKEA